MTKNENFPLLRFKGFCSAWEQQRLGEIIKAIPFNNYLKMPEQNGKYEVIQQGNFPIIGYANGKPFSEFENIVIFGDHTLSLYKPKSPFFIATDGVRIIKGKPFIEGNYLMHLLEISKPKNEGYKRYFAILCDQECKYTSNKSEQTRIGNLFEGIDSLITLHQSKRDKLLNIKKGLLEKMFPDGDENVPKIRFKDYTYAWEQQKVENISNRFDNLRIPITAINRVTGTTPYYGANGIQDYVEGFTHFGEFVLIAEDGANDLKIYPVQYVNGYIWVNNHAHVLQCDDKNSTLFLKYSISNSNIASVLVGGGRAKLNSDALMKFELKVPTKPEQTKIGNLFEKLDSLITLHQRKLEKLKNLKNGFLEKMFC